MIGRAARWFNVRFLAWALRHGVTLDQAATALTKSFPHRDTEWRGRLMAHALDRNRARTMRRLG